MENDRPNLLDDPDAPPSEEERAAADQLRRALEQGGPTGHEGAELARSLSVAFAPTEIDPIEHQAIVAKAIALGEARRRGASVIALRAWVTKRRTAATLGAAAAVSIAAGVAAVVGLGADPGPAAMRAAVIESRSTQPLFTEPFARTGGHSARIDRIALARGGDLRENRFARWGVR